MTDIAHCRICRTQIDRPAYRAAAPALTSIKTWLDGETLVHVCPRCSHAQCPDMPEIQAFYDTEYRISLESEEHDQLVAILPDGEPLYRTDHQAEVSLRMLDLQPDALILDYGAAKSDTLRKMVRQRSDLVPHVFDVSSDYAFAWDGWVQADHQAIYTVDARWHGRFDAVMSHFAIEHVADPIGFLTHIRALMKPGGRLLLSLPDVDANPGDMIIVDHLNHFTAPSIRHALETTGFSVDAVNTADFPGAFFVTATAREDHPVPLPAGVAEAIARNTEICSFWTQAKARLADAGDRLRGRDCAIYGAGVYGNWIAQQVSGKLKVVAFLDQNPNLQGDEHLGAPVRSPAELDETIRIVFVGLNPLKARGIVATVPSLQRSDLELVWLD